ncbi:MAG: PrsW family intramembrane metalloprotease [Firmicutes bacterium]|nr:PrsW family intramembrane metalloprotease [Bacillota bacterium]
MTYIENIFVCIAAPLLVTALCMGKRYARIFFFCFAGMAACLLSAYINTFFAQLYNADLINATTQIAPVVEEIMKLLPLLFYLLIFEPKAEKINTAVLIVATGFATFENICYLTQNGAAQLSFLLIRGFGTGAMHIVCGAVVGFGLVYVWPRGWLRVAGTGGLLGAAITFHAIYNLLIAYGGTVQYIAYALPVFTITTGIGASKLFKVKQQR